MYAQKLIVLTGLLCLAPGISRSQLIGPKLFGRYREYIWKNEHGLPQNSATAIMRTRDGYLWLATVEGLARFDGVRFTTFDRSNTPELRSSMIQTLLEDRAGNLWIGTNDGGLTCLKKGRFRAYTVQDGLPDEHITSLFEDHAGDLWIGTDRGLSRLHTGRFHTYNTQDGLPSNQIWSMAEDKNDSLWVGTNSGLARFAQGRFSVGALPHELANNPVRALYKDPSGNLWVGARDWLGRFRNGRFTLYRAKGGTRRVQVITITTDKDNVLWAATTGGLARLEKDRLVCYTTRDGIPEDVVLSVYADPEGGIWFGTPNNGLCRLMEGRITAYSEPDGLAENFTSSVYQDSAGHLWVGTKGGLSRFTDERFAPYRIRTGLLGPVVSSITEDCTRSLWLGTPSNLVRFKNGIMTPYSTENGLSNNDVPAVLADAKGNLWVATYGGGLNLFRNGHFTHFTTQDGLASNQLLSLFEDHTGSIWIATRGSGISRFRNGQFTTWTIKDGLPSNHVLCFYEDRMGTLWIGTHGAGLVRFRDGKLSTISSKDGLYDGLAFRILEDDEGNLWMSGNRGIYRTSLRELNDFADGHIRHVTSFAYGVADGMLTRECNAGNPAGWKTRDGRLWFATSQGVVAINPRKNNTRPPLVVIEQLSLDRKPIDPLENVRIKPGQENLEIQYTGLSWSRPKEIRFRFQLVGLDKDWVDAGLRRTAYYSHVPAGQYTFRVIADNGEGVWNTQGQSLSIVVLPRYYQTTWFKLLVTSFAGVLLVVAWRFRTVQFKREQTVRQAFSRQLIASQESERKRIAAELHDSLGQHLAIIKSMALLSINTPADHIPEQLEGISSVASQAIGEVREISYNLRPFHLDRLGLTKAVEVMVSRAFAGTQIDAVISIDAVEGTFDKELEIHFYRIVQECVNNIIKHSQATRASVIVRRTPAAISLRVDDNGSGFAQSTPNGDWSKGGFGLTGISERAQLLHGIPVIQSTPGAGTVVAIDFDVRESSKHGLDSKHGPDFNHYRG